MLALSPARDDVARVAVEQWRSQAILVALDVRHPALDAVRRSAATEAARGRLAHLLDEQAILVEQDPRVHERLIVLRVMAAIPFDRAVGSVDRADPLAIARIGRRSLDEDLQPAALGSPTRNPSDECPGLHVPRGLVLRGTWWLPVPRDHGSVRHLESFPDGGRRAHAREARARPRHSFLHRRRAPVVLDHVVAPPCFESRRDAVEIAAPSESGEGGAEPQTHLARVVSRRRAALQDPFPDLDGFRVATARQARPPRCDLPRGCPRRSARTRRTRSRDPGRGRPARLRPASARVHRRRARTRGGPRRRGRRSPGAPASSTRARTRPPAAAARPADSRGRRRRRGTRATIAAPR